MSRYRWTILALGTIGQASYSAVFLGIPVLAPQFRDEYGLSLTQNRLNQNCGGLFWSRL